MSQLNNVELFTDSEENIEANEGRTEDTEVHQENWMVLSSHGAFKSSSSERTLVSEPLWSDSRTHYSDQQLGEMANWLKSLHEQQENATIVHSFNQVDTNSFNSLQNVAYNIVKSHYENENSQRDPLFLMILGQAGTGKNYIIKAIRSILGNQCAVTAPTGKASYNVKGCTLHSLLKLPIGNKGLKQLTGQSLVKLQHNIKDTQYLLIDEFSVVGQSVLGRIDRGCRQASGHKDDVLGGKSVILVGDPAQLPSVGDKCLYHSRPTSAAGEEGNFVYSLFDDVVELDQNHRVNGCTPE